jgi:hypothetical protein
MGKSQSKPSPTPKRSEATRARPRSTDLQRQRSDDRIDSQPSLQSSAARGKYASASTQLQAVESSQAPIAAPSRHEETSDADVARMLREAEALAAEVEMGDASDGDEDLLNDLDRERPNLRQKTKGKGADDEIPEDVEITEEDLNDPHLLRGIAALESEEQKEPGEDDDDPEGDPVEKMIADVDELTLKALLVVETDVAAAKQSYDEALHTHTLLKKELGIETPNPTEVLLKECTGSRANALAFSKSGDKAAALNALKRHKALKGMLSGYGIEVT